MIATCSKSLPEQAVSERWPWEKEVSPLVKQMEKSRAKKLAHEIQAEAKRLQQEREAARNMKRNR